MIEDLPPSLRYRDFGSRVERGKAVPLTLLFAIAFLAAWGARLAFYPPRSSAEYANSSDQPLPDTSEAEVILIGSSRFVYGLNDKLLGQALGLRSTNVSRTASRLDEVGEFLPYVVANSPKVKTFVIELQAPQPEPYVRKTERQTAWHSFRSTAMLIASTWADHDYTTSQKRDFTRTHLELCALRYRLFGRVVPPPPRSFPRSDFQEDDSWRTEHEEILASLGSGRHSRKYRRSEIVAAYYRYMIEEVRSVGAEPVFILMPKAKDNDLLTEDILKSYVPDCRVIDLAALNINSDLYDPALWVDPFHLNAEGSRIATSRVAASLKTLSERSKNPVSNQPQLQR